MPFGRGEANISERQAVANVTDKDRPPLIVVFSEHVENGSLIVIFSERVENGSVGGSGSAGAQSHFQQRPYGG